MAKREVRSVRPSKEQADVMLGRLQRNADGIRAVDYDALIRFVAACRAYLPGEEAIRRDRERRRPKPDAD